jgi:hypothetical protein
MGGTFSGVDEIRATMWNWECPDPSSRKYIDTDIEESRTVLKRGCTGCGWDRESVQIHSGTASVQEHLDAGDGFWDSHVRYNTCVS